MVSFIGILTDQRVHPSIIYCVTILNNKVLSTIFRETERKNERNKQTKKKQTNKQRKVKEEEEEKEETIKNYK